MKYQSKINLAIVALLFLLMILGCQPQGGELLPIGGEGIEIATSRFEQDTALINDDDLKMKFYGTWADGGYVHLRIVFKNELKQSVKIKFDQINVKDSKNQIASFVTITEKPDFKPVYSKGENKKLPILELKSGEKKSFNLEFVALVNFSNTSEPETLSLFMPVEIGGVIREYKLQFKAISQKDSSGKSDPEVEL